MATTPRRLQPDALIFIALALILVVLMVYFGLTSIPTAIRPTLAPTSQNSVTPHP